MGLDRGRAARLGGVVLASTLVLTAAFIGVLALVGGGNNGVGRRLPGYVLAMTVDGRYHYSTSSTSSSARPV